MIKLRTFISIIFIVSVQFLNAEEKPVHLFVLSGQSNMAGMDPETGFMPEAKKLFKDEKVVYIKVAKGGQPICRWLEEWKDIAKKNGLDERTITRIHKGGKRISIRTDPLYKPWKTSFKGILYKSNLEQSEKSEVGGSETNREIVSFRSGMRVLWM